MRFQDDFRVVRADGGEKGSEKGLAWVSNVNGITRGWKSHLLQVLYSLSVSFPLRLA